MSCLQGPFRFDRSFTETGFDGKWSVLFERHWQIYGDCFTRAWPKFALMFQCSWISVLIKSWNTLAYQWSLHNTLIWHYRVFFCATHLSLQPPFIWFRVSQIQEGVCVLAHFCSKHCRVQVQIIKISYTQLSGQNTDINTQWFGFFWTLNSCVILNCSAAFV